jgi:uncharacterized membrane protein
VSSRTEAQQRADEIRTFRRELERVQREGVLELLDAQRAALSAHHDGLLAQLSQAYDIDRDTRAKNLSWGMRIASFLGAIALAASVFFTFLQFWGLIPQTVQVVVLIFMPLAMLVVTMWIQGLDATDYFTKLAALVTFTCFVLNIAMLGQIFNITPSDKALIPWAAFALLLAYACDLRLLLIAGILCIVAFISARTGTWSGMYWLDFGQRPENFFPAAVILFVVPLVIRHDRFAGFAATYRTFGLMTFFLPILVLANWSQASYLDFDADVLKGAYQVLGFSGSATAIWLGVRRNWPDVVNTGVTFMVIFLFTKFFDWWWEIMPKYLFFLVIGLTALLILFVLKRMRSAGLLGRRDATKRNAAVN